MQTLLDIRYSQKLTISNYTLKYELQSTTKQHQTHKRNTQVPAKTGESMYQQQPHYETIWLHAPNFSTSISKYFTLVHNKS